MQMMASRVLRLKEKFQNITSFFLTLLFNHKYFQHYPDEQVFKSLIHKTLIQYDSNLKSSQL